MKVKSRRWWLKLTGGTMLSTVCASVAQGNVEQEAKSSAWKMGVVADLHYGLAPDALERLGKFMLSVEEEDPDSILQLGDFNFGVDSKPCMQLWNQFQGPTYHVLGNHDMDKATKPEMCDIWQMPNPYYSFDHRGWHFVVLDRNNLQLESGKFTSYARANFYVDSQLRGFADPDQLDWLKQDLATTELPTVVFSHQGLGMDPDGDTSSAAGAIETILASALDSEGKPKVVACLCGHHHVDRYNFHTGIHYLWINSASYHWVGSAYGRMAPYTEALFTFLTFNPDRSISVQGCKSEWESPSPKERGYPEWESANSEICARELRRG